jgi:hypothetical protein
MTKIGVMSYLHELSDLGRPRLFEAHHLTELFVPVPEHECQGYQRSGDTQKRSEEKKTQKDQIDNSACHLSTLRRKPPISDAVYFGLARKFRQEIEWPLRARMCGHDIFLHPVTSSSRISAVDL